MKKTEEECILILLQSSCAAYWAKLRMAASMGKQQNGDLLPVVLAAAVILACSSLASPSQDAVITCRYTSVASELVLEALTIVLYT